MRVSAASATTRCPSLRVAIVGAGVSGIVTARHLDAARFDVTVFEREDDVGGVWSAAHAYPGIATQDEASSYAYSDFPMARRPEERVPGGEVRAYLERYAHEHGVDRCIRLRTRVVRASLVDERHWDLETADGAVERFDWLVMANGTFSAPHVPDWPGRSEFEQAGGRVVVPGALADGARLDGRRVVIVGWGKTACDIAVVAAERSARVDLIARSITWKYPRQLGPLGITYRHLTLTRAAERVLMRSYRGRSGRIMWRTIPERIPRMLLGRVLASATDRRLGLTALGLRPIHDYRASTSLVTDGFFEAVADGRVRVHRDRTVERLASAGDPAVHLSDGTRLPADVLVAATGYDRTVDPLDARVQQRLLSADGTFLLHRRILAVDVPRLAFIGWTHHYRSPVSVEIAARWLAGVLQGEVALPPEERRRRRAHPVALGRSSARAGFGNTLAGLGMHDLDELLRDLGRHLPWRVRARQIWTPLDPADYAPVLYPDGPGEPRQRLFVGHDATEGSR